ncbi:MAG TPA: rhomboid family intramembrane serine protease [Candidatus Limnocylindrales bacterium]|nr:rhomboid family intramembrane serine protease [Candidatus Limnocylindrales bacterium]
MRPTGYGGPPGYRPNLRFGPAGAVPVVVARLIAVNVAVFMLQLATGGWLTHEFGLVPALVQRGEIWRLFTYQFLHGGAMHLFLNMFALWMFGSELAPRWGSRFFLRYYFLCAVGGGILFTLVRLGTYTPSVGASGAIYGILMAYAMWFPNRQVYLYFVLPIRVRYLIVFLIVLEMMQAMQSTNTGIAHAAHLGGMGFGYAYLRWKGVQGFRPLPAGTMKTINRWRRQIARWRLQRRMRGRGWNDTLH